MKRRFRMSMNEGPSIGLTIFDRDDKAVALYSVSEYGISRLKQTKEKLATRKPENEKGIVYAHGFCFLYRTTFLQAIDYIMERNGELTKQDEFDLIFREDADDIYKYLFSRKGFRGGFSPLNEELFYKIASEESEREYKKVENSQWWK